MTIFFCVRVNSQLFMNHHYCTVAAEHLMFFFSIDTLQSSHAYYRKKGVERFMENAQNLKKKAEKYQVFRHLYALHHTFFWLFVSFTCSFPSRFSHLLFFISFPLVSCVFIKKVLVRMNPNKNLQKMAQKWLDIIISFVSDFVLPFFSFVDSLIHSTCGVSTSIFPTSSYLLLFFTFEHVFTSTQFFLSVFQQFSDQFSI